MDKTYIVKGLTYQDLKNVYPNSYFKFSYFTVKEVEEFDKLHNSYKYGNKSFKVKEFKEHYLLKNHMWWLIGDRYYLISKCPFYSIPHKKKEKKVTVKEVKTPVKEVKTPVKEEVVSETKNKVNLDKNKKISIDMMHYKNNRASFWLIILAIALNIAMFLIIYKTTECTPNIQLGIDLLINVIFMLTCFLAAEKTKRYSRAWGITSIALGIAEACRMFWIPLYYFLQFKETGKGLQDGPFVGCVMLLLIAGVSLVIAGLITLRKHRVLKKHRPLLEESGAKKDVRT